MNCNLSILRVTPRLPRMGIWYHLQLPSIKGHAMVTEDGYMISFAASQYYGSRPGIQDWYIVHDIICSLSILRVTPRLPRMGIWFHLQPLNIKGHAWVTEGGYMISFATSLYYGSRPGTQDGYIVYDIICSLSILRIMSGLPRMGIWCHLQPLNIKGHA